MNCKKCNTRMPGGTGQCPHCGWVDPGSSFSAKRSEPATTAPPRLAPSSAPLDPAAEEEDLVDLELDAGDEVAGRPARSAGNAARGGSPLGRSNKGRPRSASASTPASRSLRVNADELRALLAEEPELLEAGLDVFVDDGGQAVGAGYQTDVGTIDLLARDARGALVVVVVAEPDAEEALVADVLQRIGWVRKHLGKGKREVRAIVLLEAARDDLSYAAAAVAGTVSFKTWRVTVGFDDVDV